MGDRAPLVGLTLCGVAAPIVFTAAWIAGGLVQEGYNARREDISALAAVDAEEPWIMIAGLVMAGVLTTAFAAGLSIRLPGSRFGPALVALAGLGMIGLGLLRNDCSSLTEACEARIDAGAVSWHHKAHDILSAPVFAAAVVAPLLMAARLRVRVSSEALAFYSAATGATLAILFAVGGAEVASGWDGAIQRAAVSVAFLWMEVVALYVLWAHVRTPARV